MNRTHRETAPGEPGGDPLHQFRAGRNHHRLLQGAPGAPQRSRAAGPELPRHLRAEEPLDGRRRADRGRARAAAQGRAHLSRADLPQRGGSADPRLPREDAVTPSAEECLEIYGGKIIPFWQGRACGTRFSRVPAEWKDAYEAGCSPSSWSSAPPGHTVLDGKLYRKGMLDFKADIAAAVATLDFVDDPRGPGQAGAAQGHGHRLRRRHPLRRAACGVGRGRQPRRSRSRCANRNSRRSPRSAAAFPAHAPRDFHEALQYYWFCHLGGDHRVEWLGLPSARATWTSTSGRSTSGGLADGTLTRDEAKELLECFFVKFNNHPAPPKVGVTADESGTYTDFANINLGGLLPDGSDGSNEVTHLLLEVIDEMHLLQPSSNMQLSRKTPDAVLKHALRGHPQRLWLSVDLQRRRRGGGAAAPGQDAGGCPGGRAAAAAWRWALSARRPTSSPATST